MNCNFCESSDLKQVYKAINSRIDLTLYICQNCGLVQSTYSSHAPGADDKDDDRVKGLSCDADYSEIRVGKQQMVGDAVRAFDQGLKKEEVSRAIDFCSARGHFARKALEYFNLDSIDCIEPDAYMTKEYKDDPKINLQIGKYSEAQIEGEYDLVHSCHTLEHYSNPAKKIRFMADLVRDGGYLYVDVPNMDSVRHNYNLDEFFYDNHLYYFNQKLLREYISQLGFEVAYESKNPFAIQLLMKKTGVQGEFVIDSHVAVENEEIISDYHENISKNRTKLVKAVRIIASQLGQPEENAIFGCGRILDALIKHGGLDIDCFTHFVDNYLAVCADEVYGKKLEKQDALKGSGVKNVLLLAKSSATEIKKKIEELCPSVNIIHINDVLDQIEAS